MTGLDVKTPVVTGTAVAPVVPNAGVTEQTITPQAETKTETVTVDANGEMQVEGTPEVTPTETPKETNKAHQLAVAARRERERVAKEAEFNAKVEAFNTRAAKAQALIDAQEAYERDPDSFDAMEFIDKTGLTAEKFIDAILKHGEPKAPAPELTVEERVEAAILAREEATRVAQEQEYINNSLAGFQQGIDNEVRAAGDRWLLLSQEPGAMQDLYKHFTDRFYETEDPEVLSQATRETLYDQLENHLVEREAAKYKALEKKLTGKVSPQAPIQEETKQKETRVTPNQVKTLNNRPSVEVQRSNDLLDKDELLRKMLKELG